MPGRTPASGATTQPKATIRLGKRLNDTAQNDNQVKRLKLTTREPPEQTPETTPDARPRRNANKPKRYSEDSELSSSEKFKPTPREDSPKIILKAKSKPAPVVDHPDDDEDDVPAKYTADFLMNYIDDTPPSTPVPKATEEQVPRRVSAPMPDNPYKSVVDAARRVSAPAPFTETSKPINPSPLSQSLPNQSSAGAYYAQITDRPPIEDDEHTMLKKLQAAIYALSRLNIPTPMNPMFETGAIERQADTLIQAAAGNHSSALGALPASKTGTPDTELRILIHNAIHMLRACVMNKTQMLHDQARKAGKPKKDVNLQASMDADRAAMSVLETLTHSSALNINCVLSSERTSLMWTLYMALLYLITPPAPPMRPTATPPLPAPRQQSEPTPLVVPDSPLQKSTTYNIGTIEAAVDNFKAHEARGSVGRPPPHQFLLREQQAPSPASGSPKSHGSMPPPPVPAHRRAPAKPSAPQVVSAR
ncbi:hypothetical protein B9Z65_8584 [Elsinoe australis]|uniref:Uncharacterized protein n=1 Tax=Elsinoe australis TaxID=40998 RepID=A0A2P7YE79_9PEZI|nr:hypothetical protein B9Z65_8584 [Elsinoe australis]